MLKYNTDPTFVEQPIGRTGIESRGHRQVHGSALSNVIKKKNIPHLINSPLGGQEARGHCQVQFSALLNNTNPT
jgi:hypothetical protein